MASGGVGDGRCVEGSGEVILRDRLGASSHEIESSTPSGYECHFHPDVQVAWTQPYA
ncbi:MAG TPA: hypothetical protein PLO37_02440 [Candidatus Hydrogenedentes bacterium]|nr:hypothetical protein [Candidatus Hydrogenedentota bacterium]HPG65677.1 hypothetical protein [Candidatus Hydrogenedentota bacterium]